MIRFDIVHNNDSKTRKAVEELEKRFGEHYAGAFQNYEGDMDYETISLINEGSEEDFLEGLKRIRGVLCVSYYLVSTETVFWKRGEK